MSRRLPNPVETANPAPIPVLHSPLRNTPHKTGVVSVALMTALIALFEMTAERSGATKLDGCHDTSLCRGHRRVMLVPISLPIMAEHVRHFPLRPIHGPDAQKC